eukprot:1908266-Pyramimonas_sp.AAC.1
MRAPAAPRAARHPRRGRLPAWQNPPSPERRPQLPARAQAHRLPRRRPRVPHVDASAAVTSAGLRSWSAPAAA